MKNNVKFEQVDCRLDIIKDTLQGSFWMMATIVVFSAFFYFMFALVITKDLNMFNKNRLSMFFLILLPILIVYVVISVFAVYYTVFDFYRTLFVSVLISFESICAAWISWFIHMKFEWALGCMFFSVATISFWYLRTRNKYQKRDLFKRCIKSKIINLDNYTVKYKSLRVEIHEYKPPKNKKGKLLEKIAEQMTTGPLAFPIGLCFILILGRDGFISTQMILLSIGFALFGYFWFIYLVLMKELPAVNQLRLLEKRIGKRFINIL